MKKSKKGFTLTEVLIVVAIIVIISAAGMAGIAIAVQDADKRGQKIQELHGEGNWEAAANQKIKDNIPTLGPQDVYEESLDTPSTSTPTPTATDKPESTPTSTPASTPKPTTTPASTPKPTTTPASTPKPTTTPASTPKPTTPSTNAAGSSVNINTSEVDSWNGNISFNSGVKSVIVSTEDPKFDINAWKYKTTPLGNNQYQITYTADQYQTPDTSIQVRTHGYDLTVVSWSS